MNSTKHLVNGVDRHNIWSCLKDLESVQRYLSLELSLEIVAQDEWSLG